MISQRINAYFCGIVERESGVPGGVMAKKETAAAARVPRGRRGDAPLGTRQCRFVVTLSKYSNLDRPAYACCAQRERPA